MAARLLKDPSTANCRVFVGHLQSEDTSKMEFEQHFSKYGQVIGSLINRGFGFIQYENENSAQAAIQNENGQMFKGRRIDVKPAKKDGSGGGGGGGGGGSSGGGGGDQKNNFSSPRGGGNQSFNQKNMSFNNSNCDTSFDDNDKKNSNNSGHDEFNSNDNNNPDDDSGNDYQQFNSTQNDSFNNSNSGGGGGGSGGSGSNNNQGKDNKDQFNSSNQNKNNNTGRMDDDNSNNSSGSQNNRSGGNQNRPGNNRNQGQTGPRQRGTRGGKNRKNRAGGGDNSGNFRDRSPLNRGPMNRGPGGLGNDDKNNRDWGDHNMMRNNFNRDNFNDNNRFDDRFKDPMGMGGGPGLGMGLGGPGMGLGPGLGHGGSGLGGLGGPGLGPGPGGPGNFGRMGGPNDFPMPQAAPPVEKNDCEIIVVHKNLTEYAEAIEARLKKMGLTVDLLFPNEEVPLSRVLGNIANRGCLYAVVIMPINMEHHSLTLNILHGLPQEHRNMPTEDALALINRDFSNYKSGGRGVPFNTPFASDRHPDAIQVLLNMLADNHQLTVLQYERVIKYLEIKREEQVQVELGDAKDLAGNSLAGNDPKQAELQSRILNILNSNKSNAPIPSPVPAPAPVPAPILPASTAASSLNPTAGPTAVTPSPLLNDPTVQKALDSLLQGNLLKSIGDSQPASNVNSSAPQPIFAAFSNINRF